MTTTAVGSSLEVDGLQVDVASEGGWTPIIRDVSFSIGRGEVLGLAGESGCGKSTTAYALLAYARPGSRIAGGRVQLAGPDLLKLDGAALRRVRGARIALVPQNPATSLTPSIRIEDQIAETLVAHGYATGRAAIQRSRELLAEVGLPAPDVIGRRYPHQLSGGQQQRVVIAIAVACRPAFLVLDEPTTALDVTTQARVLALLQRLREEHGMGMLYVSHNLGVLAEMCDRIGVMYAGRLVELGATADVLGRPRHPYTRGLLAAVPRLDAPPTSGIRLRGLLRRSELPPGCSFAPRCDFARPACFEDPQRLDGPGDGHRVACWRWSEIALEEASAGVASGASSGAASGRSAGPGEPPVAVA